MTEYIWGFLAGIWQMLVAALFAYFLVWVIYDWSPLYVCSQTHGVQCTWQAVPLDTGEGQP